MNNSPASMKAANLRLLAAIAEGDLAAVQKALADGANVNAVNQDGDSQNSPGSSALHVAVNYRHPKIAEMLIEQGADLEKRTKLGETPLLLAAMGSGSPEGAATLELLLQRGAKATTADKKKQTPLHFVAFNALDPNLIDLVIEAGGKINVATKAGRTPLHRAASSCRAPNVERLLSKGADLNARDGAGKQPIHNVGDYDEIDRSVALDAARVLLAAGADPHATDNEGRALAEVCKHDPDVLQMIAAHDAKRTVSDVLSKMRLQGARPA